MEVVKRDALKSVYYTRIRENSIRYKFNPFPYYTYKIAKCFGISTKIEKEFNSWKNT